MYGDKIVLLDGQSGNGSAAEAGLLSMIPAMFANALGGNKMDPNLVAALMNGNKNQDQWGGNGCWFLWIILLFGLFGRGFGGWGGNGSFSGGLPQQLNTDYGNQLLMNAISGNRSAIEQIASTLGCTSNSLQNSLFTIQNAITQVAGQAGANYQGVVNAIQSTGCEIGNQIATCCCNLQSTINQGNCAIQNSITSQGYEGRIETLNQTNQLQNAITSGLAANRESFVNQINLLSQKVDAQTNLITSQFCGLEKRELQNKIDQLRDEKNALQSSALLQQQTANLINQLKPCAIPAYNVPNPNCCYSACNAGCGSCGATV